MLSSFFIGCSDEEKFEHFFQQQMKEMHMGEKNYSYSLVQKELDIVHGEDAIAIFTEYKDQEEKIYIAYFEKENNQWEWQQTRGAEWNSPVKWSSMNSEPFIYSGTIDDKSIVKVYAGDELAKIISIKDNKRFWYAISPVQDATVKTVKEDGTEVIVEEVNHEEF